MVPSAIAPQVVTLGEALVVIRPTDGSPVGAAGRFVLGVAGAESNVAVALARLGHRVSFAGRVGDDAAGARIVRTLRSEEVDVAAVRVDPGAPTGLLVRDVGGRRGTAVDYHRSGSAGSRLSPEDVDVDAITAARFLYVTGLTCGLSGSAAGAIVEAIRVARAAGTIICLDPNLRMKLQGPSAWERRLRPLLDSVDVVVGGGNELQIMTSTTSSDTAVSALRDHGVDTIVVRAGSGPTRAFRGDEVIEVPVDPVIPVDPVGAGDAFSGGLLSGLLDDQALDQSILRAHAVARRCVLTVGDIEGLPNRGELETAEDEVAR